MMVIDEALLAAMLHPIKYTSAKVSKRISQSDPPKNIASWRVGDAE
jgi:hypothetical protein